MEQNYKNHVRYYAPHHFIFLPLIFLLVCFNVYKVFTVAENSGVWRMLALLSFCILYLAVMLRQHYALGNQNRIIRIEFRLRYFELFGKNSLEVEKQLSFGQIAALRFAPDEEFKTLLDRTLNENLNSKEIKQSIRNWQADYMRV